LKEKSDVGSNEQVQEFVTMAKRKGKFGKFGPRKKKLRQRSNAMVVKNMGTTKEIVQSSRRTTRGKKKMRLISLKKQKNMMRINLKE
jgi:hypothetical protein